MSKKDLEETKEFTIKNSTYVKKIIKKKSNFSVFFYFLFTIIYLEVLLRLLLNTFTINTSIIPMFLYTVAFTFFLTILTKIFGKKTNKVIFILLMFLICVWYGAQFVVKNFLSVYISFSVLQISDQVNSFLDIAFVEIFKRWWQILLILMPFISSIIFHKKINFNSCKLKKFIILLIFMFSFYGFYKASLLIGKNDSNSAYNLTYTVNNPELNFERLGVINATYLDIKRTIFGFEEKIVIKKKKIKKEDEITIYKYNNLDIDFDKLISETNDPMIKSMSEYFKNEEGTKQNKYTGMFKGKNLIMFMAESFNEIAVDEERTPTLYKLVNNGFVFKNFYTPTIMSTIGGEMQEVTGLYPKAYPEFKLGNTYYPMGLATVFKDIDYKTYAFHNHYYGFQNRHLYMKAMGFDNYIGCYNGLEKKINCSLWPESDIELIEATIDDIMANEQPFFTYYTTVSGHGGYSWTGNMMSRKNKEAYEAFGYDYSLPVAAYFAAQMELDKALEILLQKLEEKGILDDTVIALVGDHYPYTLSDEEVNEAAGFEKDNVIEINRSNFILYNSKMDKIEVEKVGSQIDVVPTIYNLFNVRYDSRLYAGKDILSDEEGLAMFANRSWVTNKGKYFTLTGEFIPNKGVTVTDDYVVNTNQKVNNRINISGNIIYKNYYKVVWDYLKTTDYNVVEPLKEENKKDIKKD